MKQIRSVCVIIGCCFLHMCAENNDDETVPTADISVPIVSPTIAPTTEGFDSSQALEIHAEQAPLLPAPLENSVAISAPIDFTPTTNSSTSDNVPTESAEGNETSAHEAAVSNDEDTMGIDTVALNDPQGNWLFKRIWWERSEAKYEKIRQVVEKIMDLRMAFFDQRTQIDQKILDPFYIHIGTNQGALGQQITSLLKQLEDERQEMGSLNEQERELLTLLKAEQQSLIQIKNDLSLITQLDNEIDASLGLLIQQINLVRTYERESWEYFKEIARVLNDKRAREIFYTMDTLYKNSREIQRYIEKDFSAHFMKTTKKLQEEVTKVQAKIGELQDKGIDFKKRVAVELQDDKKNHKNTENDDNESESDDEHNKGVISRFVLDPLAHVASIIGSFFYGLWQRIFGA